MSALSELVERDTLSDHTACNVGESAINVVVNCAGHLHGNIDALYRYVPFEVKNRADFCRRLTAIKSAEHEICNMRNNHAKLSLVSKELRNTMRDFFVPPLSTVDIVTLSRKITTSLEELLADVYFKYALRWTGGGDPCDAYNPRSLYHSRNFHESKYKYIDKSDESERKVRYFDSMHAHTKLVVIKLDIAFCEFEDSPHEYTAYRNGFSVRELMFILDVLPRLDMNLDKIVWRELWHQCAHIAQLTHEYYDSGVKVEDFDNFMESLILFEDNIFTESRCPQLWQARQSMRDEMAFTDDDDIFDFGTDSEDASQHSEADANETGASPNDDDNSNLGFYDELPDQWLGGYEMAPRAD